MMRRLANNQVETDVAGAVMAYSDALLHLPTGPK